MSKNCESVLVAGAGGFIGGHLVKHLLEKGGMRVRAVDIKPLHHWYQLHAEADNFVADLQDARHCRQSVEGCAKVYNLACDMGGMGFIEANKALCMLNVLINTHLLQAAQHAGVQDYLFASTACVYNTQLQKDPDVRALAESDAYPADPEDGYGWEKLFSERMCRHFREDFGMRTRVVRIHNVYGPHGTIDGGREKAPAAICRKVATAVHQGHDSIEIWGDGTQTRSFMYISDFLEGVDRLMALDYFEPVNLGSARMVSINQLVDLVESIAGVRLQRQYKLNAPRGVAGRNSDNSLIQQLTGWQPDTPLETGLASLYSWIQPLVAQASRPGERIG